MALSKQDQEFYEQKLGLNSFSRLFFATTLVSTVMMPVVLYVQDASAGQTANWTWGVVINLAVEGFLLGSVVAIIMYLAFKFLLQMGWLPSRR
jgi:hypothetical protein